MEDSYRRESVEGFVKAQQDVLETMRVLGPAFMRVIDEAEMAAVREYERIKFRYQIPTITKNGREHFIRISCLLLLTTMISIWLFKLLTVLR